MRYRWSSSGGGFAASIALAFVLLWAPTAPAILPDFDGDGVIGPQDFFAGFVPCIGVAVASAPECAAADLDGDGVVGPADFFAVFRPLQGAVAAPALASLPEVDCSGDGGASVCRIDVAPGVSFETARENLADLPGSRGVKVAGRVEVETPIGPITLLGARLEIDFDDGPAPGIARLRGSVEAPFPSLPLLEEADVEGGLRATIGLDLGSALAALDAPLQDDRAYLFFVLSAGVRAGLPLDRILPLPFGGSEIPTVVLEQANGFTLILDPLDPFFFVAAEAPLDFGSGGGAPGVPDVGGAGGGGRGGERSLGALGFSWKGLIPFAPETTFGIGESIGLFEGHVIARGSFVFGNVPIELSGEVVASTDPTRGIEVGGNGDASVSVPVLSDLTGFAIPLSQASVGVQADGSGFSTYFAGISGFGGDWLPVDLPLVPARETRVAGFLSTENPEDFFVRAEGEIGVQATFFGDLAGLDLSELSAQEAQLVIDRQGFYLAGRSAAAFHPAVGPAGELALEGFFPFDDPTAGYLRLQGDMSVAGVGLGARASTLLNRDGLLVEGALETGISRVAMMGQITSAGPSLAGQTAVTIPVETVSQVIQVVTDGAICGYETVTDAAICGTDTIVDGAICGYEIVTDAAICGTETVQEGFRTVTDAVLCGTHTVTDAVLCGTHTVTDAAICGTKTITSAAICGTETFIDAACEIACGLLGCDCEETRPKSCSVAKSCDVANSCRVASTCSVPNFVERPATCADLSKPRSCEVPASCQIEATCETTVEVPVFHGNVAAEVSFSLDGRGLRGDVAGTFDGTTLANGRVRLGDPFEACIDVPPFGEMCAPF